MQELNRQDSWETVKMPNLRIPSSEEGKEFQGKSIEKYSIKSQKKNSQIMRKKCPHRSKRPTEYQTDKTRK